jgi:hypothetical protein
MKWTASAGSAIIFIGNKNNADSRSGQVQHARDQSVCKRAPFSIPGAAIAISDLNRLMFNFNPPWIAFYSMEGKAVFCFQGRPTARNSGGTAEGGIVAMMAGE